MKSIICLLLGVSYIVNGQYDTETDYDTTDDDCPGGYTELGECIITEITGPYKMGNLITCYEQNDQNYAGYKDKIYSDEPDKETGEVSEMCLNEATKIMCDRYKDEAYPEPGKGDVCDHTDPRTGVTRNACYFNTIYGEEINDEKTWSYKCWEITQCPLKDEDGVGRVGCQVTNRRINCCCQEDYCNGGVGSLIEEFAAYGNPINYPTDYDSICKIDFSKWDWYVLFNVPIMGEEWNAACTYDPDNPRPTGEDFDPANPNGSYGDDVDDGYDETADDETDDDGYSEPEVQTTEASAGDDYSEPEEEEEETEGETIEEEYAAAQAAFTQELAEQASKENEMVNMGDIVLIFSYFMIGIVCLGIGVFIGTKWKTSVMQQQMVKNQQLDV